MNSVTSIKNFSRVKNRSFYRFRILAIILLITVSPFALYAQTSIIFDTDMDTDCDDAGALAILHAFADKGRVKILATTVSSKYRFSAPCVQAINTYFNRPHIPVGVPKGQGASTKRGSKYARQIAEEFSCTFKTNDDAPDARKVYRKVLSEQPDNSVVIVTVGYMTNLKDLLETEGDSISEFSGVELVRKKVKYWVCMGGAYPSRLKPGGYGNFMPHWEATKMAVENWPGKIYFSGDGKRVKTGKLLRNLKAKNPVKRAYDLYLKEKSLRPSWDQVALLYALQPWAPYWQVKSRGKNEILEKGTNRWVDETDDTRHHIVTVLPEKREALILHLEKLMAHIPMSVQDDLTETGKNNKKNEIKK